MRRPTATAAADSGEEISRTPAGDAPEADTTRHPSLADRRAWPRSLQEAEARYNAARDAWTAAMRAAADGRPADLAALALAQEAYEQAVLERDRWANGTARIPIPVEEGDRTRNVEAVVGQELAWRHVREEEGERPTRGGPFGRLLRRFRRG
jgi:hypothetical protein